MTEEIAATPGWVDERVDAVFARIPPSPAIAAARNAYADCLAARKSPAAISDELGAEFEDCRATLIRSLGTVGAGIDMADLTLQLEALEAEIDRDS